MGPVSREYKLREREREESAEINYCVYLTVTGSAIISTRVFPYCLALCVLTSYSVPSSPFAIYHLCFSMELKRKFSGYVVAHYGVEHKRELQPVYEYH